MRSDEFADIETEIKLLKEKCRSLQRGPEKMVVFLELVNVIRRETQTLIKKQNANK